MALSMPILSLAGNAHPAPSALSGRSTCLWAPSRSHHPSCNYLQQQPTFYRNNVGFHHNFTVFSSSAKLAESTIVAWDAAFAQEDISVPAPESQSEPLFISILLFAAFVGLILVSIGVVYLGVTEFQEKREREKLLKEVETEAKPKAKTKGKGKGKNIILAKSGPRGFGQRIDEDE